MNIYVGNLSYQSTEADIKQAFEAFGAVASVSIIMDHDTGRSKGFAFVEMPDAKEAQAAIAGLNGKDLNGRAINVNEARPKADRGDRGGFGGGSSRGPRGGGGGMGGGRGRRDSW